MRRTPSYGGQVQPWHFGRRHPWPHAMGRNGQASSGPLFHMVPSLHTRSHPQTCKEIKKYQDFILKILSYKLEKLNFLHI